MLALWVALGIIGYLNIGSTWARISWKAWGKKRRSVAGLLCFPVCYQINRIGEYDGDSLCTKNSAFIGSFHDEGDISNYTRTMALVWPAKLLWNFFALTEMVVLKVFDRTLNIVGRIPEEMPKQLPAAKSLPPKQP